MTYCYLSKLGNPKQASHAESVGLEPHNVNFLGRLKKWLLADTIRFTTTNDTYNCYREMKWLIPVSDPY